MIKLFADYHTHTIYSHGTGTIMDNVNAAKKKGLKEIAITDHGLRHFTYGVKREKLKRMREEIDEINENNKDFKVLLGLECNIISSDGQIDLDDEAMKYMDIVLLGYHMMVRLKGVPSYVHIYGRHYLSKISKSMAEETRQSNTDIMINAIKKYKVNIITHPGARISMDTGRLAEAAAKTGTALEINSKSNIMTVDYLKVAAGHGAKFVINSDAHKPEDVGNFRNAIKLAEMAGLTSHQIINAVKS
jgi:putative hydrolase